MTPPGDSNAQIKGMGTICTVRVSHYTFEMTCSFAWLTRVLLTSQMHVCNLVN